MDDVSNPRLSQLLVDHIHTEGIALDGEESAHAPGIVRSITGADLLSPKK
jgi:hypothetical protein